MRHRLTYAGPMLLCALVLSACHDVTTSPDVQPRLEIMDAAHSDGNAHFFFLPPMVRDPSAEFTEEPFDGSLDVEVHVCIWKPAERDCGPSLEIYNMVTGPGSETVRIPDGEEYYLMNWHVDAILDDPDLQLGEGETYRIRVMVGAQELGHADVALSEDKKALESLATDTIVPLLEGRTLPIKFRIEQGFDEEFSGELVAAGYYHSCAVRTAGAAYCWGDNRYGQLGTGSPSIRETTPQLVEGGHAFVSVTTGPMHSCGVTGDGEAYCWGYDAYGQLGDGVVGSPYNQYTPVLVTGGHSWVSLSAGEYVTCGITDTGTAYCWGWNGFGQLGIGGVSYTSAIPLAVLGGHTFKSVRTLYRHVCGLASDGQAYCWGWDWYGQIGVGTTGIADGVSVWPTPTLVSGAHTFRSLDTGRQHSCGVTLSSEAYCWGFNYSGELGDGSFTQTMPYAKAIPTLVTGSHSFEKIDAGNHTCAVASGGALYCWGPNNHGQLGDPTIPEIPQANPVLVVGSHIFVSVSAGLMHTCGVTAANEVYCWGFNWYGQVGDGTYYNIRPEPTFALDLASAATP